MNWQEEIARFKHLKINDVGMFAPPREMEQAVNTYNKAVDLLESGSDDIALIALKRLAASYPMFAQAAFLLGCCQSAVGHFTEAAEHFEHVKLLDLSADEYQRAADCLNETKRQLDLKEKIEISDNRKRNSEPAMTKRKNQKNSWSDRSAVNSAAGNDTSADRIAETFSRIPGARAQILQPTGRRQRVRMASDKERKEVIRRSEFPEEEETHVVLTKEPVEYLRIVLPVLAGILLVAALIWGGVALGFRILAGRDNPLPDEKQRLVWLEQRLKQLAGNDENISKLLADYEAYIKPVETSEVQTAESTTKPAVTSTQQTTSQTTTAAVTTTTTTTISPEEIARAELYSAWELYQQAATLQSNNQIEASDLLLLSRSTLEDITGSPIIEVSMQEDEEPVELSTDDLRSEIDNMLLSVGQRAADQLRISGRAYFDRQEYELALADYVKAFSFYPLSYGGGVAYYCGRSLQELDRYDEAKPYFEFVIENYPGSELAGYAANRLRMMGF